MIFDFIPPRCDGPFAFREAPRRIWQEDLGTWALTEFAGKEIASACLRCPDTPCARYSEDEASQTLLLDVSPHPSRDVCPWTAIQPGPDGFPVVERDGCASCGLCIERCPVGAIAWGADGTAEVQIELSELHVEASVADHLRARANGAAVKERFIPRAQAWQELRRRFDLYLESIAQDRLRIVARNLLRALGAKAHASSRGDTVDRTELSFEHGQTVWLGEIEPGADLLGAVRRIMAAVAVAAARRHIPRDHLGSAVFVVNMPNSRTDGYRLIRDLAEVLQLDVAILPLSALHIALLGNKGANLSSLFDASTGLGEDPSNLDVGPAVLSALGLGSEALGPGDFFAPPK